MQNPVDTSGEAAAKGSAAAGSTSATAAPVPRKQKKQKKRNKESSKEGDGAARKKQRKHSRKTSNATASATAPSKAAANNNSSNNNAAAATSHHHPMDGGLSPAQQAVQEQMRRALEEDQYSAAGSIVEHTDSDDEDSAACYVTRDGVAVRLDKAALQQAVRKHNLLQRVGAGRYLYHTTSTNSSSSAKNIEDEEDEEDEDEEMLEDSGSGGRRNKEKSKRKKKRKNEVSQLAMDNNMHGPAGGSSTSKDPLALVDGEIDDLDRDGGSIFGATAGSSNNTWVECDKCKKWRRLRGIVDEKKLPRQWYCSMNKNDPERARCSAPEEEYEAQLHTPESAADARTRKHLRVWVRRLQCNEAFEARQPTLTRGKKRAVASSSKDPYEWVRCSNPSCGKWRALLRCLDAKTNVIDRTTNGEWYCVMNVWDEKMASCAAPQENLPAIGCPAFVQTDN